MPIKELKARKIKWKTLDDGNPHRTNLKKNYRLKPKEGYIALEPMRIRVYELTYGKAN